MTPSLVSPLAVTSRRAVTLVLLISAALVVFNVNAQGLSSPLQQQVLAAERAFAKSMADRNPDAFANFIAAEAIFFNGQMPLRGKAQIVSAWSRFFEGKVAPFSWEPDQVEVLDSGSLALSTGLVRDPEGKVIARFNSIWRLEAPGTWRVIFDKGSPPSASERQ
jgi:ketosteroid isomerase-like protein